MAVNRPSLHEGVARGQGLFTVVINPWPPVYISHLIGPLLLLL